MNTVVWRRDRRPLRGRAAARPGRARAKHVAGQTASGKNAEPCVKTRLIARLSISTFIWPPCSDQERVRPVELR